MKGLVTVKRVVDYNVKIRIKPDGSGSPLPTIAAYAQCRKYRAG
jgi:electron transfer flavoprotein beta subunit